jgi:hypothetical protein
LEYGLRVSEYSGLIYRGAISGEGGLYSKVYGILLSNVSYILAESYNINTVEHGSGKY